MKTAAERQRERRTRIRQNNAEYSAYLAKDSSRKRDVRSQLRENELSALRQRTKISTQKWRERKSQNVLKVALPRSSATPYKTAAALGRAKCRVERHLPKSPSKRIAVIEKLTDIDKHNSPVVNVRILHSPVQHGNGIPDDIMSKVKEFYLSEDISIVMPGKADVIAVKSQDGVKTTEQKHHLNMTVMEAFQSFKAKYSDINIQKSKFSELRPKNVLLSSKMPHNVCVCRYHGNIVLLLESLHRTCPSIPLYSRNEFLSSYVCDISNEMCMSNNCAKCKDSKLFTEKISDLSNIDDSIHWHQWDTDHNNYVIKALCEGTVRDAINELCAQMPKFLWHAFIKDKQASSYSDDKEIAQLLDSSSCLLQMDFAENYSCLFQDEIQSAHWHQNQVTLYTVIAYHRDEKLSIVIASDTREHEKKSVTAFTTTVIERILHQMPTVKTVKIWTDGPSSQYKNRFIFGLMIIMNNKFLNIDLSWNYFATSHGKGPNDALGGNVKAMARRHVMARKGIIKDAESLTVAIKASGSQIELIHMTQHDIDKKCVDLDILNAWNKIPLAVPGTINTHCVIPDSQTVKRKYYSSAIQEFTSVIFPTVPNEHENVPANEPLGETWNAHIADTTIEENGGGDAPVKRTMRKKDSLNKRNANLKGVGKKRIATNDDDDCECLFCSELYSHSNGDWIQCQSCYKWCHTECAGVSRNQSQFICDICN